MYKFAYLHPLCTGQFGDKNVMEHCFSQITFRIITCDVPKKKKLLGRFETNALGIGGLKHEKK